MILGWRLHHISGSVEAGYVHISSSAFREALARIKRIIGAPYAWPLPTLQPCYVCTVYTVHTAQCVQYIYKVANVHLLPDLWSGQRKHTMLCTQPADGAVPMVRWYTMYTQCTLSVHCTVDWFASPGAPLTGALFSPHMTDCEHINTLIHVTWNTECLKVHEKLHIIWVARNKTTTMMMVMVENHHWWWYWWEADYDPMPKVG